MSACIHEVLPYVQLKLTIGTKGAKEGRYREDKPDKRQYKSDDGNDEYHQKILARLLRRHIDGVHFLFQNGQFLVELNSPLN